MLLLGALLLFAATLWLDTRQNQFPFFYHPDEPDKVDQLITGKWNFHHPLLMLGTAETVKRLLGEPNTEQTLVVLGRWCSASFAALGVTAFALLGWRVRGWAGFWILGLLLLSQHQVYELAHYFKEDTALFFAMALSFLALHVFHRRPGAQTALMLGAACGLAVAAKYLGAVMLAPAAFILIAAQRGGRARGICWAMLLVGFLGVAAAVNFPVFAKLDVFTHSFGRETSLVEHGQTGSANGQVAIFTYLRTFVVDTTPVVWVLVIAEVLWQWRRRDAFEWTMVVFPFAFMLMLSCSTKTNDRYFLPATGGLYYLAALGAIDLPSLLPARWGARLRPWALAALALAANAVFLYPYLIAFAHDDRSEMLAWIRANIPATATIAGEDRADLPNAKRRERLAVQPLLPQTVREVSHVADLGPDPAALAAQGIDYIVISESDYGTYTKTSAAGHLSADSQQKRDFYENLFKNSQPLWERERGTGIYLHPGLKIYRVSKGT